MKIIQIYVNLHVYFSVDKYKKIKNTHDDSENEPENKMNEVNVLLNLANIRYLPRYIIIAIDVFN